MGNAKKRSGSVASMLPVLLACSFTASFGQSMMNVALPELAERFGVTLSIANWVIVGYMVVAATDASSVAAEKAGPGSVPNTQRSGHTAEGLPFNHH